MGNKERKLVYGVGVNDAPYKVHEWEQFDGKLKITWRCPFYDKWQSMMGRCYSLKVKSKCKTYIDCYAVPEWHYFMTFRVWMVEQDWQGNQLDKDLLVPGNKVYGPDTCVFVEQRVNNFLTESDASRGEWPIGVSFQKSANKFRAECNNPISGKRQYLGLFNTAEEAHDAWFNFKKEQAKLLASEQSDLRVAHALLKRYEDYKWKGVFN